MLYVFCFLTCQDSDNISGVIHFFVIVTFSSSNLPINTVVVIDEMLCNC